MMKICITAVALAWVATAQPDVNVAPIKNVPYQIVSAYSGTSLLYTCVARSFLPSGDRSFTSVSISAATNANPVVFTSTGHGFPVPNTAGANVRPTVTISGGTGNWTAINGTFTATIINTNTFSIPVNSTSLGALAGTIVFTTTAPRLTQPEWQVTVYGADASGNTTLAAFINGKSSMDQKCSDATSTTLNVQ